MTSSCRSWLANVTMRATVYGSSRYFIGDIPWTWTQSE
jgi:hypothetical protein